MPGSEVIEPIVSERPEWPGVPRRDFVLSAVVTLHPTEVAVGLLWDRQLWRRITIMQEKGR